MQKVPKEDCSQAPCGMKDVYQPTIPDLKELYAVGVYFYVARAIGLMGKAPEKTISPAQFQKQAEIYCEGVKGFLKYLTFPKYGTNMHIFPTRDTCT